MHVHLNMCMQVLPAQWMQVLLVERVPEGWEMLSKVRGCKIVTLQRLYVEQANWSNLRSSWQRPREHDFQDAQAQQCLGHGPAMRSQCHHGARLHRHVPGLSALLLLRRCESQPSECF